MRFLEVVIALAIKELEQRRPKLTSGERRKINSRTHMFLLFMKASRFVLRDELNTLYEILWETKYGRFTTLNMPKCKQFTLLELFLCVHCGFW